MVPDIQYLLVPKKHFGIGHRANTSVRHDNVRFRNERTVTLCRPKLDQRCCRLGQFHVGCRADIALCPIVARFFSLFGQRAATLHVSDENSFVDPVCIRADSGVDAGEVFPRTANTKTGHTRQHLNGG